MAPTIIDRPATHSTPFATRPVVGGVLHGTETHGDITTFQSAGGWHFTIQRDGTINGDVSLENAAWHTRACDRWRPVWVLNCPGSLTSDPNYCTVGIEFITDQAWRDAGEPFSEAQYVAIRELVPYLDDLFAPGGGLPWVGHGEVQLDRSDPVAFDWTRAGFGNLGPAGRYFDGIPPTPEPTPEPPSDPCAVPNAIKGVMERFVRELQPKQTPWVTATKRAAKKAGLSWADYLIKIATEGN